MSAPLATRYTLLNSMLPPVAKSIFSSLRVSPTTTRCCLPPLSNIAYALIYFAPYQRKLGLGRHEVARRHAWAFGTSVVYRFSGAAIVCQTVLMTQLN